MSFDRSLGHDTPEPRANLRTPTPGTKDSSHDAAIHRAADAPAHGCCCVDDQAEEYERWDGMA